MAKTALVTGATGQDGALLCRFLLDRGYAVAGLARRTSSPTDWRLRELGILDHSNFVIVSGDLTDQASLDSSIFENKFFPSGFDEVYNLAAQSFVGASWDLSESTLDITGVGAARLFESVRKHCPKAKVYQASSSEMFGGANRVEMLNESSPFQPRSPYGAAKILAHNMARVYRDSYGLFISCGILFNHESEYRGLEFVTRKISNAVARIYLGKENSLKLGNLSSYRDWGFAKEYVEAMWLMLQQDSPDDFVIATGQCYNVKDFCRNCFEFVGISDWESRIIINENDKRPADVGRLCGDASKAKKILGWEAKTSLKDLCIIMTKMDIERNASK